MQDAEEAPDERQTLFVIGGVGHRELEGNRQAIQERVVEQLQHLIDERPDATISLLCSIAEGADRLLIESALRVGMPWDGVLPCTPACFREDFTTCASRDEFDRLLSQARSLSQPDAAMTKEAGYIWASDAIISRAHTLLAIWDGGPGHGPAGTAETVARASAHGLPVIWIPSHPPYAVRNLSPRT